MLQSKTLESHELADTLALKPASHEIPSVDEARRMRWMLLSCRNCTPAHVVAPLSVSKCQRRPF
jgi:hypothetical protein